MKFLIVLFFAVLAVRARAGCPGCAIRLSGNALKEIESKLNYSLRKLAAGDGPYYRLEKVNTATTQIIAGIKHVISADLIDSNSQRKTCRVTIWSKPWMLNGTEISFECPGEEKIIRRHES